MELTTIWVGDSFYKVGYITDPINHKYNWLFGVNGGTTSMRRVCKDINRVVLGVF